MMTRQGLFELAHGGTLFLDELGELPLDLQPKLLRALEQREVRRVGSNKPIKVDVRIIAATNRNLEDEVRAGRFRQDLFYRLSVVRLHLPPLRERVDDIPCSSSTSSRGPYNRKSDGTQKVPGVSRAAMDLLTAYQWPGNVRELVNVIERAVSFAEGELIEPRDLPDTVRGEEAPPSRRGGSSGPINGRARPTSTPPSRMPRSAGSPRSSATTSCSCSSRTTATSRTRRARPTSIASTSAS